jgi:hypothetical protein
MLLLKRNDFLVCRHISVCKETECKLFESSNFLPILLLLNDVCNYPTGYSHSQSTCASSRSLINLTVFAELYLPELSQLPAVGHRDWNSCFARLTSNLFNRRNYVHTRNDLAKHHVLTVEPRSLSCAKKELKDIVCK